MKHLLALLLPAVAFAYNWECNLFCFNGGECRHGKGKFGSYGNVDAENPWESKDHVEGMYCSCPSGSTGLQCEISLKGCRTTENNFQHDCDNGMQCKLDKNGEGHSFYHCECDEDTVFENEYVEKYCAHISTVFCGHNKNDDSFASSQFCVNGGKCLPDDTNGTHHPGCDCPDGWEGKHCADKAGPGLLERGKEMAFDLANAQNLFLLVVAVMFGIGICAFIGNRLGLKMPKIRRRKKKSQQARKSGAGLLRTNSKRKSQAKPKKQPRVSTSGKKAGRRVGGKRVGGRPSQSAPQPHVDEESEALNQQEPMEYPMEPMVEQNVRFSNYDQPAGLTPYSDGPDAGQGEII